MLSLALMVALGAQPAAEVRIFAAASLRDAFEAIAADARSRDVSFKIAAAGSQALRLQLEHGAPADVVATADEATMEALVDAGRVARADVRIFASNRPVLVVASGAPLKSFADLPALPRVILAAPEVPIGRYTERILDNAAKVLGGDFKQRVLRRVVSRELNVRQVLAKVALGEADAGIVYESELHAAGAANVRRVEIPPEVNVVARYPIAVVADAANRAQAETFLQRVLSKDGAATLRRFGFVVDVSGAKP